MARHNLATVISFEFGRTVRKPRFWIATLAIPVVMAVVFALIFISNTVSGDSVDAQADAEISFAYTDASGIVSAETAAALGGQQATSPQEAIEAVKTGEIDAYFAYPEDPAADPIQVTGSDRGLFDNGSYEAVAEQLLVNGAQGQIGDSALAAAAAGEVAVESTIYRAGEVTGGFAEAVGPLVLLVVFFVVILLLANQMLASTLEEKENRVTEMILTTVDPTTLIIGKITSVFLVGAVQLLVFLSPVIAGTLLTRSAMTTLDLTQLRLDPWTMIVAVLLLIGGFVLFTGVLVGIGAIMPTAKDAGVIFGPLMLLMFVPFYAGSLIVSDPQALLVQVFTYFPLTAPVTAMLRNAFGTLSPVGAIIVIAELFTAGYLVVRAAVHLFRYGSIAYAHKLNLRTVLGRRSAAAADR